MPSAWPAIPQPARLVIPYISARPTRIPAYLQLWMEPRAGEAGFKSASQSYSAVICVCVRAAFHPSARGLCGAPGWPAFPALSLSKSSQIKRKRWNWFCLISAEEALHDKCKYRSCFDSWMDKLWNLKDVWGQIFRGWHVHTDCKITSWSLAVHVKSIFACANKVLMHAVRRFADTKARASSNPGFLHLYACT